MKFDFGQNLKELRHSKNLTQEQAAELLNVSKQSISRWENNITYPDIWFLPVVASFYGITVDSLLGADYETNRKALGEYAEKRREAHHLGNIQDAFELSQEAYALFPNEKSVIDNLMSDSYLMGLHDIGGRKKHYLEMCIAIAERLLKMTTDMEEQCRCIRNVATCYKLLGQQDKAVLWTNKLPSLWSGKESTGIGTLEGQEKIQAIQDSLDAVLHLIHRLLFVYAEHADLPAESRIEILEKIPKIFETLFENGDYGFFHLFLSRVYMEIAKTAQDRDKSVDCLKKAAFFAQSYDHLTACEHTSLLFEHCKISPEQFTKARNETRCEALAKELYQEDFQFLQDTAAFKSIVEQLKST